MKRMLRTTGIVAIACVVLLAPAATWGKRPDGGGGGGGNQAAYSIVDLPGPYHHVDGSSQTSAKQVSDAATDGTVYVLGEFVHEMYEGPVQPLCVWTINANGIGAEDITGLLDEAHAVNSAGIVGGEKDGRPALLLANGDTVDLGDAGNAVGKVTALNNPNADGIFQVVGTVSGDSVLWDVTVDGMVLASTMLTNSETPMFWVDDINDAGAISGILWDDVNLVTVPAVGEFDGNGQLQLTPRTNPNPSEIDYFDKCHIDSAGNLLGDGGKTASGGGYYARSVVWPVADEPVELAAGLMHAEGHGIASPGGVVQAVGGASDGREWFAYIYTNDTMTDLESISAGDQSWNFFMAYDINASGMICGQGRVGSRRKYETHGFLLVPN